MQLSLRLFLIQFFLIPGIIYGQSFTISGSIYDESSGESLIGAVLFIPSLQTGAVSNEYGFYSLTIPGRDSIILLYSFLGYETHIEHINLNQSHAIDVELKPVDVELKQVIVSGSKLSDDNVVRPQMGIIQIPLDKVKELPAILGEQDVLKVIQLLPGVQSGNEGTAGFHVRGGNIDQNLVQLDEATVYNPHHIFGFFSTFNARALNNVRLIKGGFPAQYGGRLSSILEIQMKEGNNQEYHVEGGLGMISSQLTVEGPVIRDRASFIVSGRRTYLDLLTKQFRPKGNKSNYYFYDLNAKVNWQVSPKDRVFFSFFKGRDQAEYREAQGINYQILFGNSTATFRWNHLFSPKLFLKTSLIYNQYDQDIEAIQDNSFTRVFTGINDWNAKTELQYFPNPNHSFRVGFHYTNHEFLSGGNSGAQSTTPGTTPEVNPVMSNPSKYLDELAAYINDEIIVSPALSLNIGLRVPAFLSKEVEYIRVEPRTTLKYGWSQNSSVKFSYTRMNQFVHLIPSSTAAVPTDVWIPSTRLTEPQRSEQFSLGYFRNFSDNTFETSLEVYYKDMKDQALFKEGNQLIENLDVDEFLVYGKGWSYGAELFVKKNRGRLSGWVSYTLSWTEQKFPDLNFGRTFPFRYDRRHVLSVAGSYDLNNKWTLSTVFVYSSGSAYTLPLGRINVNYGGTLFEGNYYVYESRNNVRLYPYHRLDVSVSHRKKARIFKKEYDSEWILGFYNIYSRLNPYFVYLKVDPITAQPKARQVSLLPIIPAISYNFKF